MNAYEMLLLVAVVVVIAVDFIEGLKDERSRLLLHDYSDCHRCGAFKC